MNTAQKRHAALAIKLEEEAAKAMDATKTGKSPKAAKLILEANKQRFKAGLISGKLLV